MNGNMFDELRELLKEKGELSQDAVNRLTLGALAEINNQFFTHVQVEEKRNEGVLELRDSVEELSEAVTLLSQSVIELNKKIGNVETEVKGLKENPFVTLGKYIKEKPKQSVLWGIGIFVVLYLVVGFRVLSLIVVVIGSLLGIPQDSIEWMLTWMGK